VPLCLRLRRRGRSVPAAGDRWPSSAAADGGPPDDQHEHQTGSGSQDLCSHQRTEEPVRERARERETQTDRTRNNETDAGARREREFLRKTQS